MRLRRDQMGCLVLLAVPLLSGGCKGKRDDADWSNDKADAAAPRPDVSPDSQLADSFEPVEVATNSEVPTDAHGTQPTTLSFHPLAVTLNARGGTAILEISSDSPAPPGGRKILLDKDSPGVVVPPTVSIPEGATSTTIRIRANGEEGAIVHASLADGLAAAIATVTVGDLVPAPVAGDLVINEINYDIRVNGDDANCDGQVSISDRFIELSNRSAHPVAMKGVSIWSDLGTPSEQPTFTMERSYALGSGETLIVFGWNLGTIRSAPWCNVRFFETSIGDSAAFATAAGGSLSLQAGRTVRVTAGPDKSSVGLVEPVVLPPGTGESWTRSPDFIGEFSKYTTVPGHAADRRSSPGTRVTGEPFAAASP